MDGSGDRQRTLRATPDDGAAPAGLRALVDAWLPGRRWYPAKGSTGTLPVVAVLTLEDPAGEATVRVELLRLPGGGLLQVPLVLRAPGSPAATDAAPGAVVGRLADGTAVVDGTSDAAFLRAWLAAAEGDGAGAPDLGGAKVMTGEQSNTSVLLPAASPPAILKVFRTVGVGPNPDVEVPLALSRAGWRGVPRPLAWLAASWPGADGEEGGHLGVLSELVTDAQDGFEVACRHARDDEDFADLARELGRTTAQMHDALRRALPVGGSGAPVAPRTPARTDATVLATLRDRAAAAVTAAPLLADRSGAVDRVLAQVEGLDLPPLQRVHGDYHLGQVLRAPGRGWVVLDFEGEPQASADERTRPDLALRDLAGMLRSVDYAAAVGHGTAAWAERARDALVEGYLAEAGGVTTDRLTGTLLHALELDKALYEVVYESRNRPDWVAIPLGGVDRLLDAA
ncbi:maltokinase N-terminal cap-like domain-containing protein [Actinotalea solisilvae]|uniref:maltokinase N-terminal cap-like domain-containing protein n=1 Tax=Actinotalea solisilvae TaxID=2072922 RepID=UPI0018F1D17F|nr:phosphotransferase [Actinotalea solisilvae]